VTGEGVVAPRVTAGVLNGDPRALRRLDAVVHRYALHNPVVRIKVWAPDGRIVYSDEHALIGKRFPLGADERQILAAGGVAAESSDLARPENRYERGHGDLLEVYLPIRTADGRRLLFESYQRYSSVATGGERVWLAFAPVLIGGLLLLLLFQLPLARSLVRRLRAGQAESERLLRAALEASDAERRRLAANLHDGAVQDLVGVSYTLSSAARDADDPAHRERLQEAAARTRATIRDLRTLLVDLYPPNLERAGLPAALRDLAVNLEQHDVKATLDAPESTALPKRAQALLYRIAQEALRNVIEHAQASHVLIRVAVADGVARLTITDDGVGFDPRAV
jgi:two-component system, NarL family, sensor kinase